MTAVGGSIESVSIDGRSFPVTADSDSTRKIGGYSNEFQPNGDGSTGRLIKTVMGWQVTGLSIEVDDSRADHEYLQDRADAFDFFDISVTYASGITYNGIGQITGDFDPSSQSASAPINLNGPGNLTQQ